MAPQDDFRASARFARDAITRDESAIRAQRQEMLVRRQAIVQLIEALEKAIRENGLTTTERRKDVDK